VVVAHLGVLAPARLTQVRTRLQRVGRYGGASVAAAVLAQAGLAVGYGLLRWSSTEAVALSLAVSVLPAYWINRRYVWPEREGGTAPVLSFVVLAIAGSGLTAGTTWIVAAIARNAGSDHPTLTLIVNATALATTVLVWAARFVIFDRLVFVARGTATTERNSQ
jgi:putative flippase GtrA